MARTTSELVQGIIEVDTVGIPDLTPFIEVANQLVTEVCVPAGYADDRLELIERWLAAHFYAIRDPRIAMETAGPVSTSYQFRLGLNLSVTTYGQQALILDTKGGLALLSKSAEEGKKTMTAGISWLGTPPCQ